MRFILLLIPRPMHRLMPAPMAVAGRARRIIACFDLADHTNPSENVRMIAADFVVCLS